MGVRNPLAGLVNRSEADCERLCLIDVNCIATEIGIGVFMGMNMCKPTYSSDFMPQPSSVLYEIVFRCPSK